MRPEAFLRRAFVAALVMSVAACGGATSQSGDVHPSKAVFADAGSWPAIAPGDHRLANFEPFRAVYARVYRDARGQQREDRVIVTAERVAWGEASAIMVTLVDTGNRDYEDTWSRVQTRVFAESDNRMLFQIAPVPGTARDYLVGHMDGEGVRITVVEAASGQATVQEPPVAVPQLGAPGLWVVGSMAFSDGQRIRFAAADAPAPSSILGARPVAISGPEPFDAGPAGRQEAWVATYPLGMVNARVMRNFVIDRPPYLLGKRPLDAETGETTEIGTLRLIEFSTFGGS